MKTLICSECNGRSQKNISGVMKDCIRCRGKGMVTIDRYINLRDEYWPSKFAQGQITQEAYELKVAAEQARIDFLATQPDVGGTMYRESEIGVAANTLKKAAPATTSPVPDWLSDPPPVRLPPNPDPVTIGSSFAEVPIQNVHKVIPIGSNAQLPFGLNKKTKRGDDFTSNCSLLTAAEVLKSQGFILAAVKIDK